MKFTRANALYCDKDCGANWWDNEYGCQGSDADSFCKLKYCDNNMYASNFTLSSASNLSGFSCHGIGIRFKKEEYPKQIERDIYFANDILSTHGKGNNVVNITCVNMTGKSDFQISKIIGFLSYENSIFQF